MVFLLGYQYEVQKSHSKIVDEAIRVAHIFDETMANNTKSVSKKLSYIFFEQGSKGKRKFIAEGIVQGKKETNL